MYIPTLGFGVVSDMNTPLCRLCMRRQGFLLAILVAKAVAFLHDGECNASDERKLATPFQVQPKAFFIRHFC